jgi:hypothetical protein
MIGADLEGPVARWAGIVSQYTGSAAVMESELQTVVASKQLAAA